MKERAVHVFRGWTELTDDEKTEVFNEIIKYMGSTPAEQKMIAVRVLNESKASFSFDTGPIAGGCPCCGR